MPDELPIYHGLGSSPDFEAGFSLAHQELQGTVLGLAMVSCGEAQIDEDRGDGVGTAFYEASLSFIVNREISATNTTGLRSSTR